MRTLTAALASAYGNVIARPAWLLEMQMSTTLRYSSYGAVTWNGQSWSAIDFSIDGLRVGALEVSGNLVLGNADGGFGTLALAEGFADKRIRIWGYDASIAAPAVSDPVLVCDAVGGGCEISETHVRVALRDSAEYLIAPDGFVSPEYGFNTLIPAGRTLTINGASFKLSRGR